MLATMFLKTNFFKGQLKYLGILMTQMLATKSLKTNSTARSNEVRTQFNEVHACFLKDQLSYKTK